MGGSRYGAQCAAFVMALLVTCAVAIRSTDLEDILGTVIGEAEHFGGGDAVAKDKVTSPVTISAVASAKVSLVDDAKRKVGTKEHHKEKVVLANTKAEARTSTKGDGVDMPPVVMAPTVAGVIGTEPAQTGGVPVLEMPEERRSLFGWLRDIAGGTGASISVTGDTQTDQALLRRMRSQDRVVMLLLLFAYAGSLLFSSTVAYRQARNESTVTYYADPRYHSLTTELDDVDTFLDAFNQIPKDTQLQVTGLVRLPPLPEYMVEAVRHRVAFSFALDLTPWLVRDGAERSDDHDTSVGVNPEDKEKLRDFLANNHNDLAYVELQKDVEWKDWEELATNIKSLIRERGFEGVISVRRNSREVVDVHRNNQWANFMHSRTTKVLLALSLFGWFLHAAYMWLRHEPCTVRCKYRVDIGIGQYWPLIADNIGSSGFNSGVPPPAPTAPVPTAPVPTAPVSSPAEQASMT